MSLFQPDATKPGKLILAIGAVAYILAIGIGVVVPRALFVAISVSIILPLFISAMTPTMFIIGTVTGTPIVNYSYAITAMKRNWRGLVGADLIVSALATAVAAISR